VFFPKGRRRAGQVWTLWTASPAPGALPPLVRMAYRLPVGLIVRVADEPRHAVLPPSPPFREWLRQAGLVVRTVRELRQAALAPSAAREQVALVGQAAQAVFGQLLAAAVPPRRPPWWAAWVVQGAMADAQVVQVRLLAPLPGVLPALERTVPGATDVPMVAPGDMGALAAPAVSRAWKAALVSGWAPVDWLRRPAVRAA
jgi:hypothetical protein